jgi:hypothetical protein
MRASLDFDILAFSNQQARVQVSRSRIRKIKTENIQSQQQDLYDVFYMSPDEAKKALEQKYEFLSERYESKFPKHKGLT